jgi:16S rRNA G966 N2-methylase RsmD
MIIAVTTSLKPDHDIIENAKLFAAKLNAPFCARDNNSLEMIKREFQAGAVLVISKEKTIVHTESGQYFFHLSMAELRIKNLLDGKNDHMIDAMGLSLGMSVLDCTLGLGTDAIVASYVAGEAGKVVGIENSPVIALITGMGLKNFAALSDKINITCALRRICVENADYCDYLTALPAKSFDVVYFDPMFRRPVKKSSNLLPLRGLTDNRPLDKNAVWEACRVAKRRVVMKEANESGEFERLGFIDIHGGKYSSVKYGVIFVEG